MSHRSRASRVRQHVHCDSCYSRRCRARVEVSVCCAVAFCRLQCGAVFHLCKEEEHLLLCPNVRVPCLNAAYGCPFQMTRSSQAAHLKVCPASVVCCSMEWLRWPTDDTNPHSDKALQENIMKEAEGQRDALDLAMTLVDQSDLYARLKMKPLYPELMEEEEEEETEKIDEKKDEGGVADDITNKDTNADLPKPISREISTSEPGVLRDTAQRETSAPQSAGLNRATHNLAEMMFSMERGGCAVAQANHENAKHNSTDACENRREKTQGDPEEEKRQGKLREKTSSDRRDAEGDEATPAPDTSKTGLAPWQEGVLERLGQELTPQEFNMYLVHHGRMLLAFGQIEACTPRERDFVYGSLEPIPVQTLRSFKVPDSYHYRRRVHLYDAASRAQSETRAVDTSDLPVIEEDWFSDEAAATLLGYAEKEVMGHKISESKAADGLYVDVGTQTHSFRSAPFGGRTTLADVTAGRTPRLHLQLQARSVNSRHNRASSVFTFLCGHSFRREEFATHFRNVHCDIQTCLSGWFQQRCPLAYLGCTYSQRRFKPSTQNASVTYNQQLRSFNLRPAPESSLGGDSLLSGRSRDSSSDRRWREGQTGGGEDALSSLPYEVLRHVATFLDSLSLSQLALVSQLMRQVCMSLLQERGMVTLRWARETPSHRRAKWRPEAVWEFSHLFSSVDSWRMIDMPPISTHLKVCPYYETSLRDQPVALLGLSGEERRSRPSPSLVNHFKAK